MIVTVFLKGFRHFGGDQPARRWMPWFGLNHLLYNGLQCAIYVAGDGMKSPLPSLVSLRL